MNNNVEKRCEYSGNADTVSGRTAWRAPAKYLYFLPRDICQKNNPILGYYCFISAFFFY